LSTVASGRPRERVGTGPVPWLGALLGLYLTVPVVAFAIESIGAKGETFKTPGLLGALYVSVATATISLAVTALFGIPLAYVLACWQSRARAALGVLVQLPLAIPPLMSGIVLISVLGPDTPIGRAFGGHLSETMVGIVLAQTFVSAPFLVVTARAAFAGVDASMLEHAASLGHRPISRFLRVALPLAAPGIRAGLLLAWLRAFGEYGATVVLAYHPYSLPVFNYVQFSSQGIPATRAATLSALGVAAVVGLAGWAGWRLPRAARRAPLRPSPELPVPVVNLGPETLVSVRPVPVAFDLDAAFGTFRLQVAHRASSSRLAVLGASGSGKSITLRCLAGFFGPGVGAVAYGDRAIAAVPAEERRIGYVPQGLGLFPHLEVGRQVRFGVGASDELARRWLHTLGLEGLEDRLPAELSGGQRQRVALAQALARAPDLLLLDEPFSALDAPIRGELSHELRRLQLATGLSTVLVTHDPEEAALLADEIVVLDNGRVAQAGTRAAVFSAPASPTVAGLLGIGNMHRGRIADQGTIESGGVRLSANTSNLSTGTAVWWCIRPERIMVGAGALRAVVRDVIDLGSRIELLLDAAGLELRASGPTRTLVPGAVVGLDLPADGVLVWPSVGDEATVRLDRR
jgi:ABC-type Fe3+/spermidine/putrescine transport system ATPase subunit/ABC-type sulfate transport system permease component